LEAGDDAYLASSDRLTDAVTLDLDDLGLAVRSVGDDADLRSDSAIVSSAADTRSPVVSSMSSSRPGCVRETELASAIRLSVDFPIADTATTRSLP
jgi:hypothetical protein